MGKRKRIDLLGTATITEGRSVNLKACPELKGLPGPTKMGNVPTVEFGLLFQSKGEAKRYKELWFLNNGGVIRNLERQVVYPLHAINGEVITTWKSDFDYEESDGNGGWIKVVEDSKGHETDRFKMVKKWMLAEYGIAIRITGKKKSGRRRR